jgi:putative DNA primase/helicase
MEVLIIQNNLTSLSREMVHNGYPAIQHFQADGRYHRFAINGYKNQPGYYAIEQKTSGLSAVYGDFVSNKKYFWSESSEDSLSPEEAKKNKRKKENKAVEFEKKLQHKYEKGAMAAEFYWQEGEEFESHWYLKNKNVQNYGLKLCTMNNGYNGWVMIPGYDAEGKIQALQYVSPDGEKRFMKDSRKQGSFFKIPGEMGKLVICEGYSTGASIHEATGHAVVVAFDAGNLMSVAKAVRKKYGAEAEIILAADNDQWKRDIGNIGVDSAKNAAIEIDAKLAIPKFTLTESKPTDFNDLARLEGLETVRDQIEAATLVDQDEAFKYEIEKIIHLGPIKQEFERNRLSEKYGIRKSKFDHSVRQLTESKQEVKGIVEEIEPAAEPVDGKKLLDWILADLTQRVILPAGAAEAVTLWILLSYCFEAFNVLPLLGITSPTKRCGKTTQIEILQGLVSKELSASNISSAAVFRTIEKYSPTLLIDEADTFLKNNDELRGIINSGHTRGLAFVIRVEGDNHEPVKFSTWGPKAIGMIGTLPDTIKDRAIVIQLARKMPGEKIAKTGLDFKESSKGIRAKLRRWADDHLTKLKSVSVSVPGSGNDRADDNWLPLFTIAHVIGGTWPEKVRNSMQQLANTSDDDAIGPKLLADIQDIFRKHSAGRIFSKDLIEALKELPESPWNDWNRGKGLSTNTLSSLLKHFGVKSKSIRIGFNQYKGYTLESFKDAFKRYIPSTSSVPEYQPNNINNLDKKQSVPQDFDGTDVNGDNQSNLFNCYDGTDGVDDNGDKNKIMQCRDCPACNKSQMMCHATSYFEGKSGAGLPCKIAVESCKHFERKV